MPDGKRPLGNLRCRWEDNFKMELPGIKLGVELFWLRIETDGVLFSTRKFGVPQNVYSF